MKPSDFDEGTKDPLGLGMGKLELEEFAVFMLDRHIKADQPFDQPLQYQYDHSDMVKRGWLIDHGERKYTFTKKALGLLWGKYGKE